MLSFILSKREENKITLFYNDFMYIVRKEREMNTKKNINSIKAEILLSAAYVKAKSSDQPISLLAYSDNGLLLASREYKADNMSNFSNEKVVSINSDGINNIIVRSTGNTVLKEINEILKSVR